VNHISRLRKLKIAKLETIETIEDLLLHEDTSGESFYFNEEVDVDNRDSAFIYINGNFDMDDELTHGQMVDRYFGKEISEDEDCVQRHIPDSYESLAFGDIISDGVIRVALIEKVENISLSEIAEELLSMGIDKVYQYNFLNKEVTRI